MIHVKFFASVRELLNCPGMELPLPEGTVTVGDILSEVERVSGTAISGGHLLAARNQVHVPFSEPVAEGDEIAFFPPVTGG